MSFFLSSSGGFGLGLSIVKQLTGRRGGRSSWRAKWVPAAA